MRCCPGHFGHAPGRDRCDVVADILEGTAGGFELVLEVGKHGKIEQLAASAVLRMRSPGRREVLEAREVVWAGGVAV
jgi:hypothetical protein